MRNAIREYIELTEEEKKGLWDSAIFVFDTNVLLNLYRYSSKTRDIFLQALDEFKDRVWIPRQVAEEFMEDRREVISDCSKVYTDLRTKKDVFVQQCSALLRLSVADPEIHELKETIEQWINHFEEDNPREQSFSKDDILDKLLLLFDGKVGEGFDKSKISEIEKEGADRYKKKIPPGYKDNKKSNNNYGDLIIWKELLQYAKENSKGIIFITGDRKEDWWNTFEGKTIGPRIELRKEYYSEVGNWRFHMYTMENFLSNFKRNRGESLDNAVIEEIGAVSKEYEQDGDQDKNGDFDTLDGRHISQLKERLSLLRKIYEKEIERKKSLQSYLGNCDNSSERRQFLLEIRYADENIRKVEKEIWEIESELAGISIKRSNRIPLTADELESIIG